MPQTSEDWLQEAELFQRLWHFPNCLGAIDGKHVAINKPPGSGSHFFNYKNFFSIILMAVVNANLEFLFVEVGANGKASDGDVFAKTLFAEKLYDNSFNIPDPSMLPGYDINMPYVFLANDAFPLK